MLTKPFSLMTNGSDGFFYHCLPFPLIFKFLAWFYVDYVPNWCIVDHHAQMDANKISISLLELISTFESTLFDLKFVRYLQFVPFDRVDSREIDGLFGWFKSFFSILLESSNVVGNTRTRIDNRILLVDADSRISTNKLIRNTENKWMKYWWTLFQYLIH